MLLDLIHFLLRLIEDTGYLGVFAVMFVESFFAPIPSEAIMPFAGYLASQGSFNVWALGLVGGIASYLGTLPFYSLGRWGNKDRIEKFIGKYGRYMFISIEDVERGFHFFERYGSPIVFFGRLIPIVRTVIAFPAGVFKMNFTRYSMYSLVGSILWSLLLAFAGYLLKDQWPIIEGFIGTYQNVIMGIGILVVVLWVARKLRQRRH